jgi:hypothetical protein
MKKEDTAVKATTKPSPKPRNHTPAFTQILEAQEDEIHSIVHQGTYRSEFSRRLDALEPLKGLKIEGDFQRLRNAVAAFSAKSAKKFLVRKSNDAGFVIVVRVEPAPVPEPVQV